MLELDLALVPFAREVYPGLPPEEQAIYRRLLECEDTELFGWVLQRSRPADKELAFIMERIIQHAKNRKG